MDIKYNNIIKILNKYGQSTVGKLVTIVGVKTGNLKSSISYTIDGTTSPSLNFFWLSYGKYINPWVKKTGWKTIPGYKSVINNTLYKDLARDISKQVAKDLEKSIAKDIEKINKK